MSKQNKTAGKTATKNRNNKPLHAYLLEAIRRYAEHIGQNNALSRIANNSLVGIAFAELAAIYCEDLCQTFKSFGLARMGGMA